MKHQWIAKLGLMIAWPLIAAVVLAVAWVLIPFGSIKRKDTGGYTITFPWVD